MLAPRTFLSRLKRRAFALLNHVQLRLPVFSWSTLCSAYRYAQLVQTVRILRSRRGCPWDQKQTFADMLPYLQEEVAEVYQAVRQMEQGDPVSFAQETGDLLFVVTFLVVLCEEAGLFALSLPTRSLVEKMVRRHPHVFSDAPNDLESIRIQWQQIKQQEQQAKSKHPSSTMPSIFDKLKPSLSILSEAQQIGETVARVGFDWPDVQEVWNKVCEEMEELRIELSPRPGFTPSEAPNSRNTQLAVSDDTDRRTRQQQELGDLLFTLTNLARHLSIDSAQALRDACDKFKRRFHYIEQQLHQRQQTIESSSLETLEELWKQAKATE